MNTLTIDEKISLIEKMRSHANSSQSQLTQMRHSGQDRRLEPAETFVSPGLDSKQTGVAYQEEQGIGTFRLRFIVCILAFFTFFGLYKTQIKIKGHSVSEVVQILEENQLPKQAHNYLETLAQKIGAQINAVPNQ